MTDSDLNQTEPEDMGAEGDSVEEQADAASDSSDDLNPRKRGLGRGLGALFEDEEGEDYGASASLDYDAVLEGQASNVMMGIDQLEPGPYQPRKNIEEEALSELAASITVHGVLQPLIVRLKDGETDQYEIIAGERRWRAAQQAQLHQVPVIIKDYEPEIALEVALIENLQREDLNALEEAAGYKRLMDEYDYTQIKLAAEVGKSRSHVANMMRLLSLPAEVQRFVVEGALSAGHARALLMARHPEEMARKVVNEGLSVRETERLVAAESGQTRSSTKDKSKAKAKPEKDVDTRALEEEISQALGMKVQIDMKSVSEGVLKIEYKNLDQLDEVLHRLSHFPGSRQTG